MRISFPKIKYILAGSLISGALISSVPVNSSINMSRLTQDVFVKDSVPPSGTQNPTILSSAPSSDIKICGTDKKARIVVDLTQNVLYTYNESGQPECAYRIASGKPSTPTDPGVRVVTHVETHNYKTAPRGSKRRRNPNAYGPKIICLDILDPKTGKREQTGEFIHGNNDATSIGKYASKGCMRMDNEVIKILAANVCKGDIVVILENKNRLKKSK